MDVNKIEEICKETDQYLWKAYQRDKRNMDLSADASNLEPSSGIVFPCYYVDNKRKNLRISEQEARQSFIQVLNANNLLYSVETPTENKYSFSGTGKNPCSARTDLTVYAFSQDNKVNVEFKANGISSESKNISRFSHDMKKIFSESPHYLWFHILKNNNSKTISKILQTIEKAKNEIEPKQVPVPKIFSIHICVLESEFSIHKSFSIAEKKGELPLISNDSIKTYQDKINKRQTISENNWKVFKAMS